MESEHLCFQSCGCKLALYTFMYMKKEKQFSLRSKKKRYFKEEWKVVHKWLPETLSKSLNEASWNLFFKDNSCELLLVTRTGIHWTNTILCVKIKSIQTLSSGTDSFWDSYRTCTLHIGGCIEGQQCRLRKKKKYSVADYQVMQGTRKKMKLLNFHGFYVSFCSLKTLFVYLKLLTV